MNQGLFSPDRPTASKNNHPVFQTAVAIITVIVDDIVNRCPHIP